MGKVLNKKERLYQRGQRLSTEKMDEIEYYYNKNYSIPQIERITGVYYNCMNFKWMN
jgi:hypothetical protein